MTVEWTRRRFLGALGIGALAACTSEGGVGAPAATAPPVTLGPVDFGPPAGPNPFTLGVASGDPDAASVVVWTRVASGADVVLEVAIDEAFTAIVQRHELTPDEAADRTVRALVDDLEADATYWYRFAADGHVSPVARTRTAPRVGGPFRDLVVAQLSCQRWSSGYWTALADVADQRPDLVVHCGDYVYEAETGSVRPIDVTPPTDLAGYRALWRRYKAEPELRAAHAAAPWLHTWDDHEVENNYQGLDPGDPPDGDAFGRQRAAAYRAWWEYTPTRLPAPSSGQPELPMHRVIDWGDLTRFVLLDTRQFRDDQPCADTRGTDLGPRCAETETVSMLGAAQEAWFAEVAVGHAARWTTVVQQVVVHQWRLLPGNALWNLDQWDGYTGARRRLLEVLARAPSPIVLTGDVHSSWVADLTTDFDDPDAPRVGVEFVGPGVSSDVPESLRQVSVLVEEQSPHIRYRETTKRGWVRHEITADGWTATYRLVDDASVRDGSVHAAATWRITDSDELRELDVAG